MEPQALAQAVQRGYALLREGRWDEARRYAAELDVQVPNCAPILELASEAALADDDAEAALALIDRATRAHVHPALKVKKARLLARMRRRADIPAVAAELESIAGRDARLLWQIGTIYYRCNLQRDAIRVFQRARSEAGDQPEILYDLAAARFFNGDFESAEADLDRLLDIAPQSGHALYLRATLRRQTDGRNHVDAIRQALSGKFAKPASEGAANYGLAKELEDLGDHDASFEALSRGAALFRSSLSYDLQQELNAQQGIIDNYGANTMSQAVVGHPDAGPIFIVGMPRTGTTLLERMIIQTGQVEAAGELLDFGNLLAQAAGRRIASNPSLTPGQASLGIDYAALGAEYVRGAREAAQGSARFIDKFPVNYMYCGLIRRALPSARIIHLVRDPLDTCYAVFKTLFFDSYKFSFDLSELADYYLAYRRMMDHWHRVMPGQILDVHYERLVRDTESEMQRVLSLCGLPWNPAVLDTATAPAIYATASAAQVREPVHSRSVGSSRRHLSGLAPLVERLQAAGITIPDMP